MATRMTEIASKLCINGCAYESALLCVSCAFNLLSELVERNSSYLRDFNVTFYMQNTLKENISLLKNNPNLRLMMIPEEIAKLKDAMYILEVEEK